MNIKICGLTTLTDACLALEAGATHLGFNFYPPSPRSITPEACARLLAQLPPGAVTVGIFVNTAVEVIEQILRHTGLDLAQLHGDEDPTALTRLQGRAFKAFRGIGDQHARYARAVAPAFLIDAQSSAGYGGTGQTADWAAAQAVAARYPIFLAGGLTPDNVARAIRQVQPWGVDVASGVEATPGVKDPDKVRAFVTQARLAFT